MEDDAQSEPRTAGNRTIGSRVPTCDIAEALAEGEPANPHDAVAANIRSGKAFNWCAFLWTPLYYAYRRCWLLALMWLAISCVCISSVYLLVPYALVALLLARVTPIIVSAVAGFCFVPLYRKHAQRIASAARTGGASEAKAIEAVRKRGGTRTANVWIVIAATLALSIGIAVSGITAGNALGTRTSLFAIGGSQQYERFAVDAMQQKYGIDAHVLSTTGEKSLWPFGSNGSSTATVAMSADGQTFSVMVTKDSDGTFSCADNRQTAEIEQAVCESLFGSRDIEASSISLYGSAQSFDGVDGYWGMQQVFDGENVWAFLADSNSDGDGPSMCVQAILPYSADAADGLIDDDAAQLVTATEGKVTVTAAMLRSGVEASDVSGLSPASDGHSSGFADTLSTSEPAMPDVSKWQPYLSRIATYGYRLGTGTASKGTGDRGTYALSDDRIAYYGGDCFNRCFPASTTSYPVGNGQKLVGGPYLPSGENVSDAGNVIFIQKSQYDDWAREYSNIEVLQGNTVIYKFNAAYGDYYAFSIKPADTKIPFVIIGETKF